MKKVLILILVIGVLMLGCASTFEEISEEIFSADEDFSDTRTESENPTPCGGGGSDGGGGAPG